MKLEVGMAVPTTVISISGKTNKQDIEPSMFGCKMIAEVMMNHELTKENSTLKDIHSASFLGSFKSLSYVSSQSVSFTFDTSTKKHRK